MNEETGLENHDFGALTTEQQSKLNAFKVKRAFDPNSKLPCHFFSFFIFMYKFKLLITGFSNNKKCN